MKTFQWLCAAILCLAGSIYAAEPGIKEAPVSLERTGITLRGTLLQPDAVKATWAAVIIAGSGPTDRDGNAGPYRSNSLRLLAEGLVKAGIASVRYDKRGMGGSASANLAESALRFDHYAQDAAAWVEWLRKEGKFQRVAIIGHSEGATLGLLAAQSSQADAYVSIAGMGRDFLTVLEGQLRPQLTPAPALLKESERIMAALRKGETADDVPAPLMALYRPSVQPYLISIAKVDPTQEIAKLRMPVLIVQGDTDVQVSVEDAQLLAKANPNAKLQIVAGMNHVLKTAAKGDLGAYAEPSLPLASGLVDAIAGVMKTKTTD